MSNIYKNYNPDILETIANLSNDEVFTPPELANKILDMLPEEVWSNPNLTFLDPAVKTGVFLREIASRLIDGLAEEIPDLQERVNHILTKQVFGIGITELTTLMARRTVYCSTTANGPFSICTEFDNAEGNIIFPDTEHTWDKNGRCEYCGANKDSYDGGADRESYAYPFIHDNFEKEFNNMKFDVIIGNPPYQVSTGGGFAQATPIYNIFVEKAISLKPKYVSMIIPSRWMKGGMGLKEFREKMIKSNKIEKIYDFQRSEDCFSDVAIDGGVCYFLWNSTFDGKTDYYYKDLKGEIVNSKRHLSNKFSDKIIRDDRQLSIIRKALSRNEKQFSTIVGANMHYGFKTHLFNHPKRHLDVKFSEIPKKNYSLIHGVIGVGGTKRVSKYINNESIKNNFASVGKYKLFFGKAFNSFRTIHPKTIKGHPGTLCTETFLNIGDFNTEDEMLNCATYMETKFFRALYHYNRASFIGSSSTFELIPLQDFSKPWTDEELYKKYKLTQEETDYIEDNIDPMPASDD